MSERRPRWLVAFGLGVALVCAALCGCVASLNPLFDEQTTGDGTRLIGIWRSAEDGTQLVFTASDRARSLRMLYVEKDRPAVEFIATPVHLGDQLYVDLQPRVEASSRSGFVSHHVTAWHTFARVRTELNRLQLSFASPQWLSAHLHANPASLPHFRQDGVVSLTASTSQLQDFVRRHGAWFDGAPAVFDRQ